MNYNFKYQFPTLLSNRRTTTNLIFSLLLIVGLLLVVNSNYIYKKQVQKLIDW